MIDKFDVSISSKTPTDRETVLARWPDAYAAFLGSQPLPLGHRIDVQGWIIRHGKVGDWLPITAERKKTEPEAWADASSRAEAETE